MSQTRSRLSRRAFIPGLAATIFLPTLEATMFPRRAHGAVGTMPVQAIWLYFPNGRQEGCWLGTGSGTTWEINGNPQFAGARAALAPVKGDLRWFNSCDNDRCIESPQNPGHHEKAAAAFLTGSLIYGTNTPEGGAKLSAKRSVDHVLAQHFGEEALVLSADGTRPKGIHPIAQEYLNYISFSEDGKPAEKLTDPAVMFQRMFAGAAGGSLSPTLSPDSQKRLADRASILDTVASHTTRLKSQVSSSDLARIDEYLTRVRAVELEVQQAVVSGVVPGQPLACRAAAQPAAGLEHAAKNRMILELNAIALECQRFRATSYMQDLEAEDNRFLGIPGTTSSHHNHSHRDRAYGDGSALRSIINFYLEGFAALVKALKAAKTPDGKDMLYHSVVMLGSGLGDSNGHDFVNVPVIVAGDAGGQLAPGRLVTEKVGLTAINRRILQVAGVTGAAFDSFGSGITLYAAL